MLHNSGPYGPNDVPINMGMPVNMSQMSNPMNLGNNLSNLAKMPQQAPQTPAPPYDMPDYSSFGHPPLNMGHPMSPFANYRHLNFQANYGQPNSNLQHDPTSGSVQNSMVPMNLNTQSDNAPSLMNYQNYESKKFDVNNAQYKESFSRKIPINIPQIHTKAFHKQLGMDTNYSQYNSIQETPLYSHDLSKTPDRSLIDSSRRKSLENTVKLIENILINSTPKDKLKNMNSAELYYNNSSKASLDMRNKLQNTETDSKELQSTNLDLSNKTVSVYNTSVCAADSQRTNTEIKNTNSDIHDYSPNRRKIIPNQTVDIKMGSQDTCVIDSVKPTKHYDDQITTSPHSSTTTKTVDTVQNATKIQSEIHCEPLRRSLMNNHSKPKEPQIRKEPDDKIREESDEQIREESDEQIREESDEQIREESYETVIELIAEVDIKKEIEDDVIQLKLEPLGFSDVPFLRDSNAIHRDDVEADAVIVEENNVAEAGKALEKGSNPKTYYECSHCKILFKHPKRFLIHTKWHSFGLINAKRQELAREKELKKTMKKEARIMERLNSKEVKEGIEGDVHPCKDCDKVFTVKSSLKNHRQRYHPTRVRECKICKASVVGWMQLRAHMAAHTGGAGYQCNECPKRFKYAHSLAKHRDTHLEKTHGCQQCEKKFGSQALLKMHMKCHERTARGATFRCTYCGKGFFESYNLQVHERTHRNERPFLCEICKTSFGTNSSLKRHIKVSHSTLKPFPCPTCHRCFASSTTRARHTSRAHGEPAAGAHACAACPRRYRALKELHKHVSKAHPESRE